jgi:serine/threonine-protein kinase HipA
MGRKTWAPGKTLSHFITAAFGIPLKVQREIVDAISDSVADVSSEVREAMARHPEFADIGARMLLTWNEGVTDLRASTVYALAQRERLRALDASGNPSKLTTLKHVVGRSEGLATRARKQKKKGV